MGKTPLHLAIEAEKLSMVKFLIYKGSSLNSRDSTGKSAVDLLNEHNMAYLLEKQSAIETPDKVSSISSSDSKSRFNCTKKIQIEEVKQETVDSMFDNVREYFHNHLQPK